MAIETFELEGEENCEEKIWLVFFLAYSKKGHLEKLHFTKRKVNTVIFIDGGLALSQSQTDKTSNIW